MPRRTRSDAIVAENLKKHFGDVHALDGVDITVKEGTVVGLLGPNGAGKTTAVRILTTLLAPDAGKATVLGYDVTKEPDLVRASIGLTGQFTAVDDNLTGSEFLRMVGRLYHLSTPQSRKRAEELLDRFGLSDAAGRTVKTYSGGMQRRLDLAASLVNNPKVLFLDEPTTGLDPTSRVDLWEVIRGLVREGTTLLLTTQYLEEADQLADRINVVDHGHVVAEGTSAQLKRKIGGDHLDLTVGRKVDVERSLKTLAPLIKGEPIVDGQSMSLPVVDGTGILASAVRLLDKAKVQISDIDVRTATLDDVFMALTGHAAEED
jgi:ABC-2 type transport system ATP-binding protein